MIEIWAAFIVVGFLLILLELFVGVETGFDLVMLGSALILGGLLTSFTDSLVATALCTSAICALYVGFGRKYIKAKMKVSDTKTNIDAIIGNTGIVKKSISKNTKGLVKVGNEEWIAVSEDSDNIEKDKDIVVVGIRGITLVVKATTLRRN